jgi:hypothetical protein
MHFIVQHLVVARYVGSLDLAILFVEVLEHSLVILYCILVIELFVILMTIPILIKKPWELKSVPLERRAKGGLYVV